MWGHGRLAAVVGTIVGSSVLTGLGAMVLLVPCADEGFECLGVAIVGVFTMLGGFVLGSLIGCYAALRIRRQPHAGLTLLVLVGVGAGAGVACSVLALAGVPAGAFIPIAVVCWLGLPYLARDLVFRVRSKSDDPSDILGSPSAEEAPWTSSTAQKRRPSRRRYGSS